MSYNRSMQSDTQFKSLASAVATDQSKTDVAGETASAASSPDQYEAMIKPDLQQQKAASDFVPSDRKAIKLKHKTQIEQGGREGPDPVRYGDWEKNGHCIDF